MIRFYISRTGLFSVLLFGLLAGICGTLIAQSISIVMTFSLSVSVPDQFRLIAGIALIALAFVLLGGVAFKSVHHWERRP